MKMEVKTYLENEETFILEEGTCSCGVKPQDLEDTNFIYVQINGFGVPACTKCRMLMISTERLSKLQGVIVAGGGDDLWER